MDTIQAVHMNLSALIYVHGMFQLLYVKASMHAEMYGCHLYTALGKFM